MLMHHVSPICVSLQETMIGDSNPPCPRDYVCYHTKYEPTRGSHGGCAIFVRYDVAHMLVMVFVGSHAYVQHHSLQILHTHHDFP